MHFHWNIMMLLFFNIHNIICPSFFHWGNFHFINSIPSNSSCFTSLFCFYFTKNSQMNQKQEVARQNWAFKIFFQVQLFWTLNSLHFSKISIYYAMPSKKMNINNYGKQYFLPRKCAIHPPDCTDSFVVDSITRRRKENSSSERWMEGKS